MKKEIGIIIDELAVYGVKNGPSGERLSGMDYQSLVRLLAVKRAVAE